MNFDNEKPKVEPVPESAPAKPKTFSQALQEAVEKAGISYSELAAQLGVHVTSVYAWKSGRTPAIDNLTQLDKILGTDFVPAFSRAGAKPPEVRTMPAKSEAGPVATIKPANQEKAEPKIGEAFKKLDKQFERLGRQLAPVSDDCPASEVGFTTLEEQALDILSKLADCLSLILRRSA